MTTHCSPEYRNKLVLEMDGWINSNKVLININRDLPEVSRMSK